MISRLEYQHDGQITKQRNPPLTCLPPLRLSRSASLGCRDLGSGSIGIEWLQKPSETKKRSAIELLFPIALANCQPQALEDADLNLKIIAGRYFRSIYPKSSSGPTGIFVGGGITRSGVFGETVWNASKDGGANGDQWGDQKVKRNSFN
jgi:precorrin-6B methylase 2